PEEKAEATKSGKKPPPQGECRVRDHDHITGKYRGSAHSRCNLNYNCQHYKIPVICHNLKGFDAHNVIKNLTQQASKKKITVIASNSERFMSFQIGNLKFIDSLSFLSLSLEKLVQLQGTSEAQFPHTKKQFPNLST